MNGINKKVSVDTNLLKRLYKFARPYRWYIVLGIALTIAASYLATIRPELIQRAIDNHIATGDLDGLLRIILYLGLALVGEFIFLVANTYLTRWFGQGTLYSLRNAVFEKIKSLHIQFFDKNPIGRLITRTTNDIEALSELLSDGVVNVVGDLFRIFFILYFMFTTNWKLTLVTISVLPILFYATFWFRSKVRGAFLDVRDQIARVNSFVQEHLSGMAIVQLFNREDEEKSRFKDINEAHKSAHMDTIFYFAIFWPVVEIIASTAMALVIWYGGAQSLLDMVTFGVLVQFTLYVRQFFRPIQGISQKFNVLQSALASSEKIFGVLDTENRIKDSDDPVLFKETEGRIDFNNVWFGYNEEEVVLRDLSFTVEPGQTLAIVGATGAGKSTIINLLMRFYDVDKGSITVDGIDIRKVKQADLRSHFALVLQDNALFSGTILKNITLGNPDIIEEQVRKTAESIEANRFIERLPGDYHFKLSERGASLSMGERQLICFIRAMVYNPEILILDEATSSVDSETEATVNRACDKLMEGRTSIAIAHRLSTIQNADNILVMHKGEIREQGTHNELIKVDEGIYRKLYELQYKDQILPDTEPA